MSNEGRTNAAAKAAYIHHSASPGFDAELAWNDMAGSEDWERGQWELDISAAVEAADAHDRENNIFRVRVDEEAVDKAAQAIHDLGSRGGDWDCREEGVKELYREDVRAALTVLLVDMGVHLP